LNLKSTMEIKKKLRIVKCTLENVLVL
jgi:hypothetical protein